MEKKTSFRSVDAYIVTFTEPVQEKLGELRATIREVAPEAVEKISYGMPAYMLNGPLVYFAAYQNHIGFYPTPSGIQAFQEELGDYKTSKGAVQFPIDHPLPLDLIRRIVRFRSEENLTRARHKKKK